MPRGWWWGHELTIEVFDANGERYKLTELTDLDMMKEIDADFVQWGWQWSCCRWIEWWATGVCRGVMLSYVITTCYTEWVGRSFQLSSSLDSTCHILILVQKPFGLTLAVIYYDKNWRMQVHSNGLLPFWRKYTCFMTEWMYVWNTCQPSCRVEP